MKKETDGNQATTEVSVSTVGAQRNQDTDNTVPSPVLRVETAREKENEEKNDGAALLFADPSAEVTTEPLPTDEPCRFLDGRCTVCGEPVSGMCNRPDMAGTEPLPNSDEQGPDDVLRGWNTKHQCPWCGKTISDLYEHFEDDEEVVFDCGWCEQPIRGYRWVQYTLQRPAKET